MFQGILLPVRSIIGTIFVHFFEIMQVEWRTKCFCEFWLSVFHRFSVDPTHQDHSLQNILRFIIRLL